MGAWGPGHFDNDDAMDWVWSLEDDCDGSALRNVLEPVANHRSTGQPPEVEASLAVAAAAVVARARGWSSDPLPDEAEVWLTKQSDLVDDELVALARTAIKRVQAALEGQPQTRDWLTEVNRLASELQV